jgi:hypothetical protein
MNNGLLHLHSLLRWVVLILLIITLVQSFSAKKAPGSAKGLQKTSLFLLIAAHTTFVIGLYLYFFGDLGFKLFMNSSFGEVMKNKAARFWAVEHIAGMLIAIAMITVARRKVKALAFGSAGWLYLLALIFILATVPWPFREVIGRPLI